MAKCVTGKPNQIFLQIYDFLNNSTDFLCSSTIISTATKNYRWASLKSGKFAEKTTDPPTIEEPDSEMKLHRRGRKDCAKS
jgi:hypothetical protein